MPVNSRAVRLRIPDYELPRHATSGDTGKDLIFRLFCDTIKREISDGVIAFPLAGWHGGVIAPLNVAQYIITLSGVTYELEHIDHPVTTATEHDPDLIDLEEAIITWGGQGMAGQLAGPNKLIHLELDFNGSVWRVFQGLITKAVLIREAARSEAIFQITFSVLFDPLVFPGLREWE